MTATEYIEKGYSFETEGWIVTLDDTTSEELPIAIHKDTGTMYGLEYHTYWWEKAPMIPDPAYWSTSWDVRPFDCHWGKPRLLIRDLKHMHKIKALRVRGAIHNLPGADSLGAIIC